MANGVPLVAVVFAASCGVVLFGASSAAASRAPEVYDVGGAKGWAVPPANAADRLNRWAFRHRFHVGDVLRKLSLNSHDSEQPQAGQCSFECTCSISTLVRVPNCVRLVWMVRADFKHTNNDSVLLVRPSDYDGCSAASPVRQLTGGGRGIRFRLGHPGIFFFISGVPARCEAGLRLVVLVADARGWFGGGAPTPAPAPAPGGVEDDEPSRSPSGDRPIPAAFRLFVAAVLGFLSGCFSAGLVLWLCMNCRR